MTEGVVIVGLIGYALGVEWLVVTGRLSVVQAGTLLVAPVAAAVAVLRPAWMVVALLAIPYQLEDFVPPRRRGPDRLISNRNPGNIATSTNPLQIGGDSIYGQFFAGLIDDVRVYSTALNASQIAADMNSTLTIGPHNVVVTFTQTQQYIASGPGSGSATWSVDGVVGGNSTVGTITTDGLYSPPSAVGTHTVTASSGAATANATVYVSNSPGVFTFHNDLMRTGRNLDEIALSPSTVNSSTFGKLYSYNLDGLTYASPVYMADVNIPGQGFHNMVFVATEHDSLYAFDANGRSSTPLWQVSFIDPANGVTTVPAADTGETADIPVEIGIASTPVIDPATNTIYVLAKTKEVSGGITAYVRRLHALDVRTGAEKFNGPVVITAHVPGNGPDAQNGQIFFNPLMNAQRSAVSLINGVIYLAFSSHGGIHPFHGWVIAYSAQNLQQQTMSFCATPNGDNGGVWMDGDGIATDSSGDLYFITGNGLFDADTGGSDYADSFIRLGTDGALHDYFTPSVQAQLAAGNLDLASGGVLLLPDQGGAHPHEMVSAGKGGTLYVVDRDAMGHFSTTDAGAVQVLTNIFAKKTGPTGGNFSSPVYYNGAVYFAPVQDNIQRFSLNNGTLSTAPTSKTAAVYDQRGGTMSISANASSGGILWALQSSGDAASILHGYSPADLQTELYNSGQAGSRDTLGAWKKFSLPVVANGHVYVATDSQLVIYGLLP